MKIVNYAGALVEDVYTQARSSYQSINTFRGEKIKPYANENAVYVVRLNSASS